MDKKVVIINYNTTELTQACIKSINKVTPGCQIYVFDNSDKEEFVNIFDNVSIIDNTRGQIINFEEWLNEYPKAKKSTGAHNNHASAKHCYTIEKCMDLLDEPFVLMDSDVLLKKDFSNLFDEKCFYVADTDFQPGRKIKRILPYICFINAPLCKENGVHYFDDAYMHGLGNTKFKNSDGYDTGAAFYLNANKYPHKDIKHTDYVVHLRNGSWVKSKVTSAKEWLEKNKKLWQDNTDTMEEIKKPYTNYINKIKEFGKKRDFNFDLKNPRTIQEKINWLKIYDSTPLKSKCADKVRVHEYSMEKLGKDICIPILKVYNSTNEINWDELPNSFVIKCNHGSGMNIIVKDKSKLNKKDAINKLNEWMKQDFALKFGYELHYHDIERKIFVEKYMKDEIQKESLYDYKFWCFNGEPKFYTINDGHGHGDIVYYDMEDKVMNPYMVEIKQGYAKPKNFDLMVEYSKKLSEDFKFVRVDFYEIDGEVYLGELTFTPGSGLFRYKDEKYSLIFGNMLDLGEKPKNKKVVYTCISGKYDTLMDPIYVNDDFDYICYTDQPFNSNIWEIRPIPEELNYLSQVKKQRYIKVNAHKFLSDYELSVWVDASIVIRGDLNEYIEKNIHKEDGVMFVGQHPQRNCIYEEAKACISLKKDTSENINRQIERYRKEGFPKNYGLPQTSIVFRYHNDEGCKRLMEAWWNEIENGSHRDQLSFNYALWKNSDVKIKYLDKSIFNCKYLKHGSRHVKPVFNTTTEKQKSNSGVTRVLDIKKDSPKKTVKKEIENIRKKTSYIKVKRDTYGYNGLTGY